ncbi:ATP-binding protein [Sphaerospermopsis kisseleviana CS-549]|uniref:ATP-binding protein n=1 Tax=Sphaerospermopsis kisseleviana CS-549 TaxID=3021783 RepID=A0ABT4ZZ63_9CYAN|nr:ATP-binding protein [Sphaerospermopsis kisseleviana]MDB9444703.1 ATP-binding protein [Sphaerospermopsis kisseleviana CS-549]BAZ81518.1 hypothetical protein NIES73_27860 [Sphaerospermopsis kisseleviana NIES-73]
MNNIIQNTIDIPRYPPEFQQIITAKNHNFVGREFVFSAINNFLHQYDRGYFTIIGEPGIGKSAIIAHYVNENPGIVYYNVHISGKNRADEFLSNVCTQLIEIAQAKGIKNIDDNLINSTTENSSFLSLLLQQISDKLHPEQRLIITIDGCDRIDINNQIRGSNLFYLPRYLPEKVYFILARRPFLADKSGLLIETPSQSLDLSNYPEQNRADIQEYIKKYIKNSSPENINHQLTPDETNFMYVREVLTGNNLDNLIKYYQIHWKQMFLKTLSHESMALQVLTMLVKEQPISLETIAERLDEDEYDIKVILDNWREFLHLENIADEINYSLYHPHFCQWLREKIELSE